MRTKARGDSPPRVLLCLVAQFLKLPSIRTDPSAGLLRMQHGDIGFYYDLWAIWLCLTALVASGWAMTSAKTMRCGSGSIITVSYISLVCCCICSVLFSARAGNDCGNLLTILCGLLA
jgi:hypothetical protein